MGRPRIKTVLEHAEITINNYADNVPKNKSNTITSNSGVYALFYGDKLQYVGQASNLQQRIEQHIRNDEISFGNVGWYDIHHMQIEKAEEMLIANYNPPYNVQKR